MNNFESKEHDLMIPSYLLNDFESKPLALIDVLFSNENEKAFKSLLKKLKTLKKNMILKLFGKQRKTLSIP